MRPVEILSQEHRVIEVMLDCLEQMADKAENSGSVDKVAASQAIDFIRNFADRCHHGKEEGRLFPAMVAKGMPQEGGPIGVMLMEHDMGRQFVAQMADNLEAASAGDRAALTEFLTGARNYVQLLHGHIQKEDRILFPMADRVLDDSDQRALLEEFETVEAKDMGEDVHERYLETAKTLAARYGVDASALEHVHHGHAHSHAAKR